MSKGLIIGLSVLVFSLLFVGVLASTVISTSNREIDLRTTIETKQVDNKNEFDNMWKKISQSVQVTDKQKDALKDIFVGYASARSGGKQAGDNSFINAVQEAIPTVDTKVWANLQNIIIGSRDSFTMRQKELLDLNREHKALLRKFPSGFILSTLFGRKEINIVIVTSSKSEEAFNSGKDDDVNLSK